MTKKKKNLNIQSNKCSLIRKMGSEVHTVINVTSLEYSSENVNASNDGLCGISIFK